MASIALHRLTDWPTFRHLQPLLDGLGIGRESLDRWHYFYRRDAIKRSPFDRLREVGGQPAHDEVLLALSEFYAGCAPDLVGAKEDEIAVGFHWSATKERLVAAAKKAGHTARFASELVGTAPPTAAHLPPLYTKWERSALRAMLEQALEPASAKLALRYIDDDGLIPKLVPGKDASTASLELYFGFVDWSARQERALDVFVAATGRRACPVWGISGDRGHAFDDSAGRLRDALAARGVPDPVIFDALCKPPEPGSSQVAFGHGDWPSRQVLLAGWFGRLDEVAAMGPGRAAALFEAQIALPPGLRVLAGIALERWCKNGGFARLDLPGLAACTYVDQHDGGEAFDERSARAYTARVLDLDAPALSDLIGVRERGGPKGAGERRRFDAAVKGATTRDDANLMQWKRARDLGLVTDAAFSAGVVAAFRRVLAAEFRTEPHGFGDHEGFIAVAPAVARADPDLCLRGFVALTGCFNEYGLKSHQEEWDTVVPKRGFSRQAIAEAAAHFSSPARRSAAKILAKLLGARAIALGPAKAPPLAKVDETFHVGTDVAHLIIGGYDAVDKVAALEDPDDWPGAIKRHKCVGLETGGDGQYTVRVLGAAPGRAVKAIAAAKAKGAAHVATFPLEIQDDALTVSGIVGAGGTPTISFPSGVYAADVFAKDASVTVIVTATKTAPRWLFKKDLPHL